MEVSDVFIIETNKQTFFDLLISKAKTELFSFSLRPNSDSADNTFVDIVIDGNEHRYLVIDNVVPCGFI
jgi:hypothetical protein